ncbi:hypothetical protein HK101_007810 [Irineochytrium annulatum]|nr:hypothetical protein HK101_007810 [Irineochytrium annulatum]
MKGKVRDRDASLPREKAYREKEKEALRDTLRKKAIKVERFSSNLSDYELITEIGGVDDISYLYLARYNPTQELVALKYTDLTLSPHYEFVEELIRTVRNATLCRHPCILPYFASFVENERLWTVTLPVRGGSCMRIMEKRFPEGFSEVAVATILREVLHAVIYLHQNHMIHNDIRADNILLDGDGDVRLSGLRQLVSLSQHGLHRKSVFSLVGDNIEWAAPELTAQNANYDTKVDIYSFGITALELAFNRTPFDQWPAMKVLLSKLEYDCPTIPGVGIEGKQMSASFHHLVTECLHKDPTRRPSAQDLMGFAFLRLAKKSSLKSLMAASSSDNLRTK